MTIRGYVDGVKNNVILGWAATIDDRSGDYGLIAVEALLNGRSIARVRADQFRADLKRQGIGTGRHGFEIQLPSYLRNGGPFLIQVRTAVVAGSEVELGRMMVLRGEAIDPTAQIELSPPPSDANLDSMLTYVRSVSLQAILAGAEEVRAELGNAAVVAYLFGRLLERMPDQEAYASYLAALTTGVLDTRGLMTDILQSEEYRSR